MKKSFLIIFAAAISFASCKSNIEPEIASSGDADFSKYIAIGNSLTAGYADNSLYKSGQENSYPAILAKQFSFAGGGDFTQPLLPGESGWPSSKLVLAVHPDCKGVPSLGPVPYPNQSDTSGSGLNVAAQGPYNNLGIPGVRCIDFSFPGYAMLNPYAARLVDNPMNPLMTFATAQQPTFFSVWLGSNDVLGYATNGGEGSTSGIGLSDISPVNTFKQTYQALIKGLAENGKAKGVLINIPDITSIPFFTTISPRGLILSVEQAAQLTQAYAPLGMTFSEGENYFIIQDVLAPGGMRKIKDGEYIILTTPSDSLKCAGWGSIKPIPKQFVLSEDEVANVQNATRAFNEIIAFEAQEYGLALMDANTYIKTFKTGIYWDGAKYSLNFVTGGLFSLDGVHLNPRGYAMVANQVIRTINAYYKSTIPLAEVNQYNGILFP